MFVVGGGESRKDLSEVLFIVIMRRAIDREEKYARLVISRQGAREYVFKIPAHLSSTLICLFLFLARGFRFTRFPLVVIYQDPSTRCLMHKMSFTVFCSRMMCDDVMDSSAKPISTHRNNDARCCSVI